MAAGTMVRMTSTRRRAQAVPMDEWAPLAACADLDPLPFTSEGTTTGQRAAAAAAKAVCLTNCPVRTECLHYALNTSQHGGVWGGLDDAQRDRMQRERERLAEQRASERTSSMAQS